VSIREFLSDETFERYRRAAEISMFAGNQIGVLDREDLLALIGWMGENPDLIPRRRVPLLTQGRAA
jgi:hypothetical protein